MTSKILGTQTIEQLPEQTAITDEAFTAVQEPGGKVNKVKIRRLLGKLISTNAAKATQAALYADLAFDENMTGLVFADPTPAKNGWYRKVGASGAGNWTQFEKLGAQALAEVNAVIAQAEAAKDAAVAAAASIDTVRTGVVSALQSRNCIPRTPPGWDIGMAVPTRIACVNGTFAAFAKRDAAFKEGWRDGNALRFVDTVDGAWWDSVSLAKMKDPEANGLALTEVFHHYTTGADGNPGTEPSHKKNFSAALAVAGDLLIRPLSNIVGSTSMARAWTKNANVKIKGSRADGKPTYIVDMRDGQPWAITDLGDGVFKTNQFVAFSAKNGPIICNIRTLDSNGRPIVYRYDANAYADDAARKAALLALAGPGEGAWLLDTTAGANTEGWYWKTADGLAPNFGPDASHIYSEAGALGQWRPAAGKLIYCENLSFVYNAKTADQAAINFRTDGVIAGQNQEWTGEVALYNCSFYFSGKQGLRIDDVKRVHVDRFVSYGNHEDSINPHSFNTAAGINPLQGSYMKMTFSNGICEGVGNFGWRDQAALSRSGNAFTVHDLIGFTGFNLVGGNTFGAVCAMVGGSKSWLVNCHMHTPTNPDGEGPIAGNLANDGSPSAPYWADGAGTELWLSMCSGTGGYETLVATNGAKIYIDNFIGGWTARVVGGGQILDFDGNVLVS